MKLIANYNNEQKIINIDLLDKWIKIKIKLIKLFNIFEEYIDLEFINKIPIREFGKQALLIGIMESIYDDYYVKDFMTKLDRELNFNIHLKNLNTDEKKNVEKIKTANCIFTDNDFPPL